MLLPEEQKFRTRGNAEPGGRRVAMTCWCPYKGEAEAAGSGSLCISGFVKTFVEAFFPLQAEGLRGGWITPNVPPST